MFEGLTRPTAVIEGRAPLPAHLMPDGLPQRKTRQTELPKFVAAEGADTLYVEAQDPEVYDSLGRICVFRPYGAAEPVHATLEPGTYAWRHRDGSDLAAYRDGDGYNSARSRVLATRSGLWDELKAMGLAGYGVETIAEPRAQDWASEEVFFVKPEITSDVSDVGTDPGTRARLVAGRDLAATLAERFAGGVVLQRPEPLLPAAELLDQLGLEVGDSKAGYLHAIRVFSLDGVTPAVELRLTDPNPNTSNPKGDIGKLFATELPPLLESELVFDRLRALAAVYNITRDAFKARYGGNNYFAFDYIVRQDGSVKLLNALLRAMTPNLPKDEDRDTEAGRLATATVAVEGSYLARLAIARFNAS